MRFLGLDCGKVKMSLKGPDIRSPPPPVAPKPKVGAAAAAGNTQLKRIQSNCMMLDLRQQVQWQSKVIQDLKVERDRLTKELASRLFFVEAQLRREQKHIESLLNEKDQYIRFQELQIESLRSVLSHVDYEYRQHHQCTTHRGRSASSSGRRPKMTAPLSKRYSVALEEYMKDNSIVSRAQPIVVQESDKMECSQKRPRSRCSRAFSLPELRLENSPHCIGPDQCYVAYNNLNSPHGISQDTIDELAAQRWTSDCDSEHSDSLDSGISSPSINSRNFKLDNMAPNFEGGNNVKAARRGSTIGNFLNRKFSFSSTQLEKIKGNDNSASTTNSTRRHGSFSDIETKSLAGGECLQTQDDPKPRKFISSANRTFGTNHRSVMKPRDIKFKKLFKFRRRTEPAEPDVIRCEDYMTV